MPTPTWRPAHDRRYRDVCARRSTLRLVAGSQLSPELDHLFLKVDHRPLAHGCQSDEFHDYRPYPAMAGKGFVELGEPVEEFPSDNGFGIERYPPHSAERREVGCLFGMGAPSCERRPPAAAGGPKEPSCRHGERGQSGHFWYNKRAEDECGRTPAPDAG